MEKFIMSELGDNEQVVLDVPVGCLRLHYDTLHDGAGEMVFSISEECADPGTRAYDEDCSDAVRIICQTPEKAETIARAFIELASYMRKTNG